MRSRRIFRINGNILRKIAKVWQQPACGLYPSYVSCWFVDNNSYQPYGEVTSVSSYDAPVYYSQLYSTTTTLADVSPNQVSQVTYDSYDQYNNPTSVTEYDYGSGGRGPELRQTKTTYLTNGYDTVNTATTTIYIRRAPALRTVYNGSGAQAAQTTYSYDVPATSAEAGTPSGYASPPAASSCNPVPSGLCLGNLTSTQQWLSTTGGLLSTSRTYDSLGNVLSATDPNGNKTTYGYADSFSNATTTLPAGQSTFAFPTTVTMPFRRRRPTSTTISSDGRPKPWTPTSSLPGSRTSTR